MDAGSQAASGTRALGGSLVIVAQMPEGKIVIDQFSHDSTDDVDSAEA